MAIDLQWEDENGRLLEKVDDSKGTFVQFLAATPSAETVCLRFIDHYGDTTFNQLQIPIFISELENALELVTDSNMQEQVRKILALARKSHGKTHTYLKFYGD